MACTHNLYRYRNYRESALTYKPHDVCTSKAWFVIDSWASLSSSYLLPQND